ncbi:MAG: cytochrome b5 domain-containing protein [bacterium]
MKKITTITIIVFALILLVVTLLGYLYPPQTAATLKKAVSTNPAKVVSKAGVILNTAEVAKHNSQSDCYLIVSSKVYDVTTYIGQHPGGKNSIIKTCGQEVSGIFTSIHTNRAWDLLGTYYIGDLVK